MKKGLIFGIIFLMIGANLVSGFNTNLNPQPVNRSWLYVGGSGPGNYTTIQSAIDAANPGDTVFVYNGTYIENDHIRVNKSIDLLGEDKNTTIIDLNYIPSSNNVIFCVTSNNVNITNIQIINAGEFSIKFHNANYSSISNCIMHSSFWNGTLFFKSNNCIISNCSIYDVCVGINIWDSCNVTIYHNNLINNSQNAYDGGTNTWYNPEIQEGNYWSDYTGEDSNGDGIGDTPYNIPVGSNQDLYPFMYPNGWIPPSYVWVDDDYNSSTPGWGYDHFSSIQVGIDAVDVGGTVFVFNGIYYENILVDKTTILIGEDNNNTIIDGGGITNTINITTNYVDISNFSFIHGPGNTDYAGVMFYQSNFSKISSCNIYNNSGCGVILKFSSNITIVNSKINSNYNGVYYFQSKNNILINCQISASPGIGILLWMSLKNTFTLNRIDTTNSDGFLFYSSSENLIDNNNISGNDTGISVQDGSNNTIDNNVIQCKRGITLSYSNSNTIKNNVIYKAAQMGLYLSTSSNNLIIQNTFLNNSEQGILMYSYSNTIYHNNFINNNPNAVDPETNTWDNGYPAGGNYWSDYNGTDTNDDGIGDEPYYISGGTNQDLYPLMYPFEMYITLKIILPDIPIYEGDAFPVAIHSLAERPIFNAKVTFDNQIYTTDANGTTWLTAPGVETDTYYEITANKDGYIGTTGTILVQNVPEELVRSFIIGKITNLSSQGEYITFEAVKTRVITFSPFSFNTYVSGEPFTISKEYQGFIGLRFIFALCKILV